jgi:pyruvate/2-oxoglutarate dehydrogenase complex dihydrolipoamide acyltransferase (E2) component
VWIIIPLIYVMAYRFCRSFRQSFHETAAFVIGYLGSAGVILALDVGGYDGLRATPDSPGAALAILGGFVGMIVSHVRWKRRGGDPPRQPGSWERAFRAVLSGSSKAKRPAARPASRPAAAQPAPTQKTVAASPQTANQQPPRAAPARQAAANGERRSPAADKYAKATGRALAAMFNSGKKAKPGARR